MRGDGLPLGDEGTPSFAWGSHPPARHPILAPTARRAGSSPHHGCGLCLLCGEPLPAARSRIDSGSAGGGAERERAGEGERGEGSEKAAVTQAGPLPALSSPLITIRKRDPRPAGRDREGARLGRGTPSISLFSTVAFLYTKSSPRARPWEKLGT